MTEGQTLAQQIHEDWVTHNRRTLHPGFHAVAVHRLGTWGLAQPAPLRQLVMLVYKVLNNLLVRNVYGVELFVDTVVGRRLLIGHHVGVVLGGGSVIGDDVLVRHAVTLGQSHEGSGSPRIGDRVELGAGSAVLGDVTVGDGARIGPGAVVLTDVPAGAVAAAPSARVLKLPPTQAAAPRDAS